MTITLRPKLVRTLPLAALALCLGMHASAESGLYVNYSAHPRTTDLAHFDVCILDPEAVIDLNAARRPGQTFLAYVSTVEARPGSALEAAARDLEVPAIARNEEWHSAVLDITSANWADAVIQVASAAAAKGYDGLFLDTVDSVHLLAKAAPAKGDAATKAMVSLLKRLRVEFPAAKLVMNRGFEFLDGATGVLDGVLVESVYQTCDAGMKTFQQVSESGSSWLEERIKKVQSLGLPVYAVDYVKPGDTELADRTFERLRRLGCIPFVTTPALDGTMLAPVREAARRILVLHGWNPELTDKPVSWPIDTITAGHWQVFLEWMGYEVDYSNIGKQGVPDRIGGDYAGVILDQSLALSPEEEFQMTDFLLSLRERGVPVLFGGGIPFSIEENVARLSRAYGCRGSWRRVNGVQDATVVAIDKDIMNAECEVKPRSLMFEDLVAPANARLFLSVQGHTASGTDVRFDPVFLSSWGGMWLEPYIVERASQEHRRFYADPVRFLGAWLEQGGSFPVPDTTTLNGRRIFYSHIDGDGFSSLANIAGHPTCAEVVRDKVLKAYALPVTVSVIEAEMRGWLKSAEPDAAQKLQEIARSIFALPNVQPASHTFSHPFQMFADDPNPGHYTLKHAPLNDEAEADYPSIDEEREVRGSIEFINKELLPTGRKCELLLWPGNTRPGPRALRVCRELGVENMNGGDTIISKIYPGVAGIAPRTASWDGELQVFAANQNEFMYADGFAGPYFGGFASVVDTFKLTESPRRFKPVNVYYHFYSATHAGSLQALKQVYDWCEAQPLHPITALEYATMVRDCQAARVKRLAPMLWQFESGGQVRTLRLAMEMGEPDMARSKGVLGWCTTNGVRYVHTDGRPIVQLALSKDAPAEHLRLADASVTLQFQELHERRAVFTTTGWGRSVHITFAGVKPRARVRQQQGNRHADLLADDAGTLSLRLSAQVTEPMSLEVVVP